MDINLNSTFPILRNQFPRNSRRKWAARYSQREASFDGRKKKKREITVVLFVRAIQQARTVRV